MSDFDYTPLNTAFPLLSRDRAVHLPDGRVDSENLTAQFRIPDSHNVIIPHTMSVCGTFSLPSGSRVGNSLASSIESVVVMSSTGDVLSRQNQFWRYHHMVSDLSVTKPQAEGSGWPQGLDLRQDNNGADVTQLSDLEIRTFSIPLSLSGYFSSRHPLPLHATRGLQLVIRFRPVSDWNAGTTASFSLSNVHLSYEYLDTTREPALQQALSKPKKIHFCETELYTTQVQANSTQVRISAPSRYRSVRKVTAALYANRTALKCDYRMRGAIDAAHVRIGTTVVPSGDRVQGLAELFQLLMSSHGGAQAGILTKDQYASDRFMVGIPFSTSESKVSGMSSGDASMEVVLDCIPGANVGGASVQAIAFVQGDCYLDTASGIVER